jgi:Helix-turn-helix domain
VILAPRKTFIFKLLLEFDMTKHISAKQKMVNYLSKTEGYNTFSTAQGRRLFGVQNVSARIDELRQEGHCIYTNTVTKADGSKVKVYRLGTPTKAMVRAALKSGYSFTA